MNIDEILAEPIFKVDKGPPSTSAGITLADIEAQQWNLLNEDLPLPAVVIKQSLLEHNARWMRDFLQQHDVLLAPHGKTTMSPQLLDLQMRHGAWGVTVATVSQLRVFRRFGATRVLMANQLVGADDIRYVSSELERDANFEFYCLVDSVAGAERVSRLLGEKTTRPLRVLLEVGLSGGRTGCRNRRQAEAVAQAIDTAGNLALYGIECYEGILVSDDAEKDAKNVDSFITGLREAFSYCSDNDLFADPDSVLLSAGGSAYFDIIARKLPRIGGDNVQIIVRSGCYLTHDSVQYERQMDRIEARAEGTLPVHGRLKPAIEVWAYVQSVPEPGLAILSVGKRDISYDIDLPVVEKWFRSSGMQAPRPIEGGMTVLRLNDQHAYLSFTSEDQLQVGDMLGLGISHPCTTFDKWRLVWLVDDDYRVVSGVRTFF